MAPETRGPPSHPPTRIPEPYLRAEIAAFPLASEKAFNLGLIYLEPNIGDERQDSPEHPCHKTRELWRECERQFAPHTGWSLDRLVAARDRGWFGCEPRDVRGPVPLHTYLRRLARDHLALYEGVTEILPNRDLGTLDAADHYQWLTFTMPEDLLLTGLGVEPAPIQVSFEPPLLVRRLVDLGVAEIHQHGGAGMDFNLLWASALAAIATPEVGKDDLKSPEAPFSNGTFLIYWLIAAAVARCTLTEFLIRGGESFSAFLREHFDIQCAPVAGKRRRTTSAAWTPRRRETLHGALTALATGKPDIDGFEALRDLYADLHPGASEVKRSPVKSVTEVYHRCDPIAARLDLHGEDVGERWFLRKGLAYLGAQEQHPAAARDDCFALFFWQVIRVRCQYFRTVVQRPLTGGLQWFIRFSDRIACLRGPLNPIRPEVCYSVAGGGKGIRALELRQGFDKSPVEIGTGLVKSLESWKRVLEEHGSTNFSPEFGIVYHFAKERDKKQSWPKGIPPAFWAETFAEPYEYRQGADMEHERYTGSYVQLCRQAQALGELIDAVPSSLWVIRGLDVARDELAIPTWVLVPLFRYVQDVAARASLRREAEGAGPPLKITAHVGEDFRHLLEGMRRVYEQVDYVLGGSTGRLGHAIALGVDPRSWADSVSSIFMPAEERLWDLVFEWRLYTKYRIRPEYLAAAPKGRVGVILNEIRALSALVFCGKDYRVEELAETHHVLHKFLVPPYTKAPEAGGGYDTFVKAARATRIGELLNAYLDDHAVFVAGQEIIDIAVAGEVPALEAVQHAMRNGVARSNIVVEVNPSSNLLIGDLLDLRNHPILRLSPPVPAEDGPPPVAIAIGSDDPITFSTQLLREYARLYQAACAAGYPDRTVHNWLDAIRSNGMDARFTETWKPDALTKTRALIRDLQRYLHDPRK